MVYYITNKKKEIVKINIPESFIKEFKERTGYPVLDSFAQFAYNIVEDNFSIKSFLDELMKQGVREREEDDNFADAILNNRIEASPENEVLTIVDGKLAIRDKDTGGIIRFITS